MLAVAIGIKLTSPGPVLFKQNRYGLNGKQIPVWKFRTMRVMENSAVVTQATRNDPRITRFGAFLRKTSLDELPQFFNVLQGTMSIVGPRPHAVAHNEQYRLLVENYMIRHKVKPGITGLAQIHGFRGETDTIDKMEKRIQYDLEYIQSWSLLLDIKIVFFNVFPRICGEKCVLNSLSSRVYWRFLTHGRTCRLNHIPVWLASISRARWVMTSVTMTT